MFRTRWNFKTRQCFNSEALCILYKELCNCAGVRMEIISGMIKRDDYKIGDNLYKHK